MRNRSARRPPRIGEAKPHLQTLGDGIWVCSAPLVSGAIRGVGVTCEDAYVDWQRRFSLWLNNRRE